MNFGKNPSWCFIAVSLVSGIGTVMGGIPEKVTDIIVGVYVSYIFLSAGAWCIDKLRSIINSRMPFAS